MSSPIERDQARRQKKLRRYGRAHQALRAAVAPSVAAGLVTCHFCRKPIRRGEAWDLDHTLDGQTWRGPTHAVCNRRDAGLRSTAPGPGPSRDWFS